jgi:hypothetical protein
MSSRTALAVVVFLVWATATVAAIGLQSVQDFDNRIHPAHAADQSSVPPPPDPPVTALTPPAAPGQNPLMPGPPPPPSPPPPLPAAPVTVAGTPCRSDVSACVRLSTDQAWLISDGKVVFGPVSITSGKSGQRTPAGMHEVLWKDKNHLSKEFNDAPMPWSVFFADGGIAFHTGSLRAESSGCVHLANANAKRFFTFLQVGDRVQVFR